MRSTATTADTESVTQTITVIVSFWNSGVDTITAVVIVSVVVVVLVIVTYKGTSFIVIITQR